MDALITVGVLMLFAGLSQILFLLNGDLDEFDIASLFVLSVLMIARWTTGYLWGIAASGIGVILIDILYVEPLYRINFWIQGYPIIMICLLLIAMITSGMTGQNKRRLEEARQRERTAEAVAEFSGRMMITGDYDSIIDQSMKTIADALDTSVIFLRGSTSLKMSDGRWYGAIPEEMDAEAESRAAAMCFGTESITGAGTGGAAGTQFRFYPLVSHGNKEGVLGILWNSIPDYEMMLRVSTMIDWTALALERYDLERKAQRSAVEAESANMRGNLLRSISHDLRTPLTGIIGATSVLIDNKDSINPADAVALFQDVNEDATWLLRMTENLLSISRLAVSKDERVIIQKQDEAVEEILFEAMRRCRKRMPEAQLEAMVPDDLLFVPMSATLIIQVLLNLMENGVRYGGTRVTVEVHQEGEWACFSVRDYGPGLSAEVLEKLFTSVSPKKPEAGRGLGIGLTLCKSIINAHGGEIIGTNHEDGGAYFRFTLPMEERTYDEAE